MTYQGIDFQEQGPSVHARIGRPKGLVGLVMKWGWAKNQQQANAVLVGIAIGTLVLAFGIFFINSTHREAPPLETPTELIPE